MARVQCLFAFWLLSTCVPATAQVSVQSFFCQGVVLGLLPVNLELLIGDNITPGVPIRVVVGLTVNLQNSIENYKGWHIFRERLVLADHECLHNCF